MSMGALVPSVNPSAQMSSVPAQAELLRNGSNFAVQHLTFFTFCVRNLNIVR